MSINYITKHVCWVVFVMCLLISGNQVSADTGICRFGADKEDYNFYDPHDCKNGDTAIWRVDADNDLIFKPHLFIAFNCKLDGKIIQGIADVGYKEGFVICEFQQKVERE